MVALIPILTLSLILSTSQPKQPLLPTNSDQQPTSQSIGILSFNARRIVLKHNELCAVVEVNNPDIVCVAETWLDADITDSEIDLPGYQVHAQTRQEQAWWWCSILCKEYFCISSISHTRQPRSSYLIYRQ